MGAFDKALPEVLGIVSCSDRCVCVCVRLHARTHTCMYMRNCVHVILEALGAIPKCVHLFLFVYFYRQGLSMGSRAPQIGVAGWLVSRIDSPILTSPAPELQATSYLAALLGFPRIMPKSYA